MSYNLLNIKDFTDKNINFDLPNNQNNKICCKNILKNIYQTPKLISKSKVYSKNDEEYIDILITDNDFLKFLKNVDTFIMNETITKNNVWFRKELPKETLQNYYSSVIQKDKKDKYISIKLINNTKLYDENNENIEKENINELDTLILLISIDNIIFEQNNFYVTLIGNHIKLYKQKISLTDMIKTNNGLDNEIINNLASNENSEEEYSDSEEYSEEEDNDLDDYEISSRMIVNKRNKLSDVYKDAEDASVNAHKLRKEAIELAQELEDYESIKTEMN
tara:strand:+ start:553 stop:1386 length:834 start_codon:yes stop_codon:yes gene_type:complete